VIFLKFVTAYWIWLSFFPRKILIRFLPSGCNLQNHSAMGSVRDGLVSCDWLWMGGRGGRK